MKFMEWKNVIPNDIEESCVSSNSDDIAFKKKSAEEFLRKLTEELDKEPNVNISKSKNNDTSKPIRLITAEKITNDGNRVSNEVSALVKKHYDLIESRFFSDETKQSTFASKIYNRIAYIFYRNMIAKTLVKYVNTSFMREDNMTLINFPTFVFTFCILCIHLIFCTGNMNVKLYFLSCFISVYITYLPLFVLYFSDVLSVEEKNSNIMDLYFITTILIIHAAIYNIWDVFKYNFAKLTG